MPTSSIAEILPPMRISPSVGAVIPAGSFSGVLLPAPFGPIIPSASPCFTSRGYISQGPREAVYDLCFQGASFAIHLPRAVAPGGHAPPVSGSTSKFHSALKNPCRDRRQMMSAIEASRCLKNIYASGNRTSEISADFSSDSNSGGRCSITTRRNPSTAPTSGFNM